MSYECQKLVSQIGRNLLIDENIVEGTAEVSKATFDDYEGDDILHDDGHEMLVVCKSLLTNDWLKTTIFKPPARFQIESAD